MPMATPAMMAAGITIAKAMRMALSLSDSERNEIILILSIHRKK